MGFDTHAIFPGHPTAEDIADSISALPGVTLLQWRRMRHPDHVVFELRSTDGNQMIEGFLNSLGEEASAEALGGPGALLTSEFSPTSVAMLSALPGVQLVRPHEMAEWTPVRFLNAPTDG